MKINVTTTLELEREKEGPLSSKEMEQLHDEFSEVIRMTYESGDLNAFIFVDPETMLEVDEE